MGATITIGNVLSQESGEKKLAFLRELFAHSFLKLEFGLAPIGGSCNILAISHDKHLAERAEEDGQTPEEYLRDSILQTIVNLPNLPLAAR